MRGYESLGEFLRAEAIWQATELVCEAKKKAGCHGRIKYRLTSTGPWKLDREQSECDKCGRIYSLRLKSQTDARVTVAAAPLIESR